MQAQLTTPRVVSLVPSVTETLIDWGVTPVGVTRFCEQPELPQVGGTKSPDIEAVIALAPDVVVMDEEENRIEDHRALVEAGVEVQVLAVRSVRDVGPAMRALAARVGAPWRPPALPEGHGPVVAGPRRRAFVPIWRRP